MNDSIIYDQILVTKILSLIIISDENLLLTINFFIANILFCRSKSILASLKALENDHQRTLLQWPANFFESVILPKHVRILEKFTENQGTISIIGEIQDWQWNADLLLGRCMASGPTAQRQVPWDVCYLKDRL